MFKVVGVVFFLLAMILIVVAGRILEKLTGGEIRGFNAAKHGEVGVLCAIFAMFSLLLGIFFLGLGLG